MSLNKMMIAVVVLGTTNAFSMPTKLELSEAQPLVNELLSPLKKSFDDTSVEDKSEAAVKLGDAAAEFAKSASTEAARFLLLKGAVGYYARGKAYDKAADALVNLQGTVKDIPAAVVAEITGKAVEKVPEASAPRLYAIYRKSSVQIRAEREVKTLAVKLKKIKTDSDQRRYAELLAVLGNWKSAYDEFANVSSAKLKSVVRAEAAGKVRNAVAGEFWWSYEPVFKDADVIFKEHAAVYYRKALEGGEIDGLKKTIVEQRLASLAGGVAKKKSKTEEVKEELPVAETSESEQEEVEDGSPDGDVAYEIRIVDVISDGGTTWMWTNKNPGMEMDKSSSADSKVTAMSRGASPLGKRNVCGREYEGTKWIDGNRDYWIRKEFDLNVDLDKLVGGYLSVQFDRNCEIWLNGEEVYSSGAVSWHYHKCVLDVSRFRKGKNILAAHIQNDKGNGWFDMGMVVVGNGLRSLAKIRTSKAVPFVRVSMDSILPEHGVVKAGIHGGDEWAYTFIRPTSAWKTFGFDDKLWKRGTGGFGGGTQMSGWREYEKISKSIKTKWEGDNIWLRRKITFNGTSADVKSAILCIRGWGAKVYFNGEFIAKEMDINRSPSPEESDMWDAYDVTDRIKKLLKSGEKNIIAVEVKQEHRSGISWWSRYIDVGLYVDVHSKGVR